MASVVLMVGGAILNAAAFIGGNYLAKTFGGSGADEEKKRHDRALEKYQADDGDEDRNPWGGETGGDDDDGDGEWSEMHPPGSSTRQEEKKRQQFLDWIETQRENKDQADQNLRDTDTL